jgi:uncharacterized repeat protein (TIGR02543 family)
MKKNITVLFLAGLLSLTMAACGTDNGSSSSIRKSSSAQTSVLTTQVTSAQDVYSVTFSLNYAEGGNLSVVKVNANGKVAKPSAPTRTGYLFVDWYTDSACTSVFDFNTAISGDLTLYAKWEEAAASDLLTVTFYYNYSEAPSEGIYYTVQIKKKRKVAAPSAPVRTGYYFIAWYTDAACSEAFDFDKALTEDKSAYAKWTSVFTFEAEYVDLADKAGYGYSGNVSETEMIGKDNFNAGASNGYYVSYLYYNGAYLEFDVTAPAEVTGVYFIARLSSEFYDMVLSDANYSFTVNDVALTGFAIDLSGAVPVTSIGLRPFQDYLISSNATLKQGKNVIKMTTNNSHYHVGTMYADAPLIDCLKLGTEAALTWEPHTENLKGK